MDDRFFITLGHGLDGRIQHGVHELCIGACANRPTDDHAIETVDHRRQINLPCRDMEFRDVREPLFVGSRRLKIAINEVLRGGTDFSNIRTIPAALWSCRNVTRLLHQASHDLLRNKHAPSAQLGLNPPIAVGAMGFLEDFGDRRTYFGIFIGSAYRGPMVEIGTARQVEPIKQLSQGILRSQGVNQRRLLLVAQKSWVDAQIFPKKLISISVTPLAAASIQTVQRAGAAV